jgi:hypothetical protein
MSELENSTRHFLQRWSQRKRAAENHAPGDAKLSPEDKKTDTNAAAQSDAILPAFDPATLPPIESITTTSDVRAFLAPGVPEELTRAALRRVWVTDPTIRDFIGIAENQWDFTKPDTVPGFGSLEITPELRRLISQLVGDAPQIPIGQSNQRTAGTSESLPPTPVGAGGNHGAAAEWSQPQPVAQVNDDAAAQRDGQDADAGTPSARRKHGSAMPG